MKEFLRRRIFVFDIDNTLLEWSNPFIFFRDVQYTKTILKQRPTLNYHRGFRTPFSYKRSSSSPKFILATWLQKFLGHLQSTGQPVAIFSDIPHHELHSLLESYGISVIINEQGIQALKPLPDGLWNIASMLGGSNGQIIMIGDQRTTDGLSAFRAGAHFYHIDTIQQQGWEAFLKTLPFELPN